MPLFYITYYQGHAFIVVPREFTLLMTSWHFSIQIYLDLFDKLLCCMSHYFISFTLTNNVVINILVLYKYLVLVFYS